MVNALRVRGRETSCQNLAGSLESSFRCILMMSGISTNHIFMQNTVSIEIILFLDGEILEGAMPKRQLALIGAIHEEERYKTWIKAVKQENPDKIEPLNGSICLSPGYGKMLLSMVALSVRCCLSINQR